MKIAEVRPGTLALGGAMLAVIATIGVGFALGLELAILVLSAFVLIGVIALFWLSVRNLSGDTPLTLDEALGLGAPTAAEEQKRAVLRALKDLEFERSVGKISEDDYREFSARYRAEAKRLIAAVDEALGPVQELAESLVQDRLAKAGLSAATSTATAERAAKPEQVVPAPSDAVERGSSAASANLSEEVEPESAPAPKAADGPPALVPKVRSCAQCSSSNDVDARFCKRCGAPLEAERAERAAAAVEEELP